MIEAFNKFIDASFAAVARAQVGESFSRLARTFGYESTLVFDMRDIDQLLTSAVVFASPVNGQKASLPFTTHPLFWHAVSIDHPFTLRDMCALYELREAKMRAWIPEQLRKADLLNLPVHRDGALVLYAGCSGTDVDQSPVACAALHTAAHIVFDRINLMAKQAVLTNREADCLFLAAQGKTYPEIARTLSLSSRTVRAAVAHAKSALNAKTKAEAIAKAITLTGP